MGRHTFLDFSHEIGRKPVGESEMYIILSTNSSYIA
jgi:hypothetical protein